MYRYALRFQLEHSFLPKELDRLLVSFLKASVKEYSLEMFNKLYDKNKSIIKSYSFSYFLPGAVFGKDTIKLKDNTFTMFFSDSDLVESIHFFNAFKLMQFKMYPMNRNSMKLISINIKDCKKITDSEVIIKMQSSLIVRRHNKDNNTDIYYIYDQEGFNETLKENVEIFLQRMELPISVEGFSIVPIKAKKVVANVFGRSVDCNIGIFKLTGNPELLNLLYLSGIGVRRSEGHGLWEVLM
jgi:CRISPR-associated endoribonuclease Cas6